MKIRNKIVLIFTLVTGSLLILAFGFIYYFSYRYTENEFYERLTERTEIVAQAHLERDELSTWLYDEIKKRHFQTLPDEEETLISVKAAEKKILQKDYDDRFPEHFLEEIFEKKHSQIKTGEVFHTGILYDDNEGDFIVVASARDQYGNAKLSNLRNILIVALLVSVTVTYIIGRIYAGRVLNPISEITNQANEISASNLHKRLEVGPNKDELADLSRTINNMLERLETSFEIQTSFVNNASHEFKNPLTAILGETEVVLERDRSLGEYKTSLITIEKEAQRLNLLVSNLLKLAQAGQDSKNLFIEHIRIDELVLSAKESIDHLYPDNKLVFDFSRLPNQSESLVVLGNTSLLNMAVTNIMDNACKFSMQKAVHISIKSQAKTIEISVKDEGVGIPLHEQRDIAEPFFRASNARAFKGFGIGLSLAQKIVALHGGVIKILSQELKGTEVKIILPLSNSLIENSNAVLMQH